MKFSNNKISCITMIRSACLNENGAALVIALMFMAILGVLGTSAYIMTSTDMQIGANYKTSVQAFNVAQAGTEEALYRLRLVDDGGTNPPPYGSMISINGLIDDNAAISFDPNVLLTNDIDDDGNTVVDDISDLNYNGTWDNRDWQARIMLSTSTPAGQVDQVTFVTNTIQPSGSWLEYSSTDAGTALTVEFVKDTDDMDGDGNYGEIVFYDPVLLTYNVEGLGGNHASGRPAVVITSTGNAQGSKKRIKIGATPQPVDMTAKAAVMVNMSPTISGSALISGFDHILNTTDTDEKDGPKWHLMAAPESVFNINGIDNHGGKQVPAVGPSPDYDLTLVAGEELAFETRIPYGQKLHTTGHVPGVWTPLGVGTILPDSDVFGGCGTGGDPTDPACSWKEEFTFTWMSLADILGIDQPTLDKILEEANVTYADVDGSGQLSVAPMGITYIDNAGKLDLKLSSTGQGLMYITGNLIVQSLNFKGLIYVEGDENITGGFWLLGAMAIKGVTTGDFSAGNGTFLYSRDALETYVNAGMAWKPLWWSDELG